MATPTTLPGNVSVGGLVTADFMNNLLGAFRILQVVAASNTTFIQVSSGTYVDSGLTANITPRFASSQILAFASHSIYQSAPGTGTNIRLLRGSTVLNTTLDHCFGPGSQMLSTWSLMWLDSPSSTSSLTYKTQLARGNGPGVIYGQINNNPATLVLMEVSA